MGGGSANQDFLWLFHTGGMEGNMIELAASIALSEIESALSANGIQVPDRAIQQLLDKRKWIYQSERIQKMREKLNEEQLYSVFNLQHHLQSSAQLFQFLASMNKKVAVVYGHKAQGKTQFLFFLFKLLQAMGEKVLFLDRTIMSFEENSTVDIRDAKFCGHLWREDFLQIGDEVKDCLGKFFQDALPTSFGQFLFALRHYTRSSGTRIWIIIDEVVLFEKFPIRLPEEQDLGPFNWIVTGSAGIGSWVGKKHLEKLVFDLPLFSKEECFDFANNLCNSLHISLETGIDGLQLIGLRSDLEELLDILPSCLLRFQTRIQYHSISLVWLEESTGSFLIQQNEEAFLTSNLLMIGSMKSSLP
jgi:hypothetical protein